jgi:hypothetical protein
MRKINFKNHIQLCQYYCYRYLMFCAEIEKIQKYFVTVTDVMVKIMTRIIVIM